MKKIKENNQLGNFIRSRRKELGMSQEILGSKVGYTKSGISKIECGDNDIPMSKINDLAIALECSPAQLLQWTPIEHELNCDMAVLDIQLISLYNQLTQPNKDIVINLMRNLIHAQE